MAARRRRPATFATVTGLVVLILAASAVASPAPVSACPPCSDGFVRAATSHDLDTDVRHGVATVHVHANGSASWQVQVVPTNEAVLDRLAENRSLARAVAGDSFGVRYGGDVDHELDRATVVDGAFEIRYRTAGVVRESALATLTLTYFRDVPGAYVYTELGADALTVVAPPGTTVARGFGDVEGRRMTATELPRTRDGPFVVFAPEHSTAPQLRGALAVADLLAGTIARNVGLFVALPGGILVGGLAVMRRLLDVTRAWRPTRLGGVVAGAGGLVLAATVASEAAVLPVVTGHLLVGSVGGVVLLGLGGGIAAPAVRQHLTPLRLIAVGLVAAVIAVASVDGWFGAGAFDRTLAAAIGLLPAASALGWLEAQGTARARRHADRLFVAVTLAVLGGLAAIAPLTALGGALFMLAPLLLAVAAVAAVITFVPLYLLGAAGARAATG